MKKKKKKEGGKKKEKKEEKKQEEGRGGRGAQMSVNSERRYRLARRSLWLTVLVPQTKLHPRPSLSPPPRVHSHNPY